MRVFGQQEDRPGGCQHEQGSDQGFLGPGPVFFCPVEEARSQQGGTNRGQLHCVWTFLPTEETRSNHAERRNLSDGEIDKNDAAPEHHLSQRHMGAQHQHPSHHSGGR